MELLNIQINLSKIHCYKHNNLGSSAEHYVWIIFFKIDRDAVFVNNNSYIQGYIQLNFLVQKVSHIINKFNSDQNSKKT